MEYTINANKRFRKEINQLSEKAFRIVNDKIRLLKINPFRNKRIKGYNLFLFRIRFEDQRKEKRIIYQVDSSKVILICILDRDDDYKGLARMLKI